MTASLAALGRVRARDWRLAEAASAWVPAVISELEAETIRPHGRPDFVLDLSGRDIPAWPMAEHGSPAKFLCGHTDAVVFAQNSVIDAHGWACEAHQFRVQYLRAFNGTYYRASFPGRRPELEDAGVEMRASFAALDDADVVVVDAPVFLATPLEPDNWGRWVSTVIPKAVWFREHGVGRLFFCRMAHGWQRGVLNALGLGDDRLLDHDPGRVYVCRDLTTIRYMRGNLTASPGDLLAYGLVRQAFRAPSAGGKRLFVSRRTLSLKRPGYRVLQNEEELSAGLEGLGFTVIEPEGLAFREQVAAFGNAEMVVGLGGAGMFNAAFCQAGTRVVTVESGDHFIRAHARLFSSLGLRYGVVFGRQDAGDAAPVHKRWSLDVGAVVGAVAGWGLCPEAPTRASGPGPASIQGVGAQ